MKHLIVILVFFSASLAFSQDKSYSKLWQKVENFEVQGLVNSALKEVEAIEVKARKTSNSAQIIKVLLFKSKFILILEEDAQLNIISSFKTEISKAKSPTKNVLENILAQLYWQYFKQHRYKFYNRTKTKAKVDSVDFRTWDLETLFNTIYMHFDNSLHNGLVLQQTPLQDFSVIITQAKDSKMYRPTLFDFLSYNALEFYTTTEHSITQPAYKFEIDTPHYFANAKTFSTLKFTTNDSTSLHVKALQVYKALIRFHLNSTYTYALADANISRLQYVLKHATIKNKEQLFINIHMPVLRSNDFSTSQLK